MTKLRALLSLLSLAALPLACSDEAIVLATIPESASDGGSRPPPQRCVTPSDCSSGSLCEKHDCDDVHGVCEAAPALCGDEEDLVCGCDGVTYFNDCLRKAAGVAPLHAGECASEAVRCDSATPCPGSATCATLLGYGDGSCAGAQQGTCWVVPATCPAATTPDQFDACDHSARCVDTCTAIRSGAPYFRASRCP